MHDEVILGNEAIALGLVEQGCRVATAYPGTPSSEILAGVIKFKKRLAREMYVEWSVNEKVAFEVALAASWTGLRAAVAMKQVGLNVAADPLFSAAYLGVKGGFIVVPADDPGPYSSQTEQDSRLMALSAKVPVLDPSTPAEARAMVEYAFELSERFGLPVILRPTTRLCHARQSLAVDDTPALDTGVPSVKFHKDPARWSATPRMRYRLHVELNEKLRRVEAEFAESPLNTIVDGAAKTRVGVIASGVAFQTARQALRELGVSVPLLKIGTPYPLPRALVERFTSGLERVVVLEEPDACIELQLPDRGSIRGRLDGTVPSAGELSPEVVWTVLAGVLIDAGYCSDTPENDGTPPRAGDDCMIVPPDDTELQAAIDALALPVRRPTMCPACAHRSAFFAIKREFKSTAIFPGDIGCYTLGLNLHAVDTCVDMGASVSMAAGFYQANRLGGDTRPIVATIGDSTFLHSGLGPLVNAVHTGARFVLVVLDNHTTAMTGFQPTAASEILAQEGEPARKVSIMDLARACGVGFVRITDPYDQDAFRCVLREANDHAQAPEGGVAVVIAERPCVLYDPSPLRQNPRPVVVTEDCDGCGYCINAFE
ncbi:MAG: indolepyruvate oxidoreductase, partial [Anaerolineae bacterium]|nr:indolepyruvate oxidoreductase [Anaerolineae bacterium]